MRNKVKSERQLIHPYIIVASKSFGQKFQQSVGLNVGTTGVETQFLNIANYIPIFLGALITEFWKNTMFHIDMSSAEIYVIYDVRLNL